MSPRKTLAKYGPHGARVRVFIESNGELVRVRWSEQKKPKTQSWPNTPAGRASAKTFAETLSELRSRPAVQPRVTLRELYERFATAEFPNLRPNSQRLYNEAWQRWETMWGRGFIAEDTTLEMVDLFRKELRKTLALSTIRHTIRIAKMVYAWGERREVLSRNRLRLYQFKTAKEDATESPAEYRADEFKKLLAALDPTLASQWRAYVALAICGYQGARQQAVLHLQMDDLDFSTGSGVITWRSEWDKMGKTWTQPMRKPTDAAIAIALQWRIEKQYKGPWLIPSGSSKNESETYSAQSLWAALRRAEVKAGIAHVNRRGAHGLRRMLSGDVNALTGDPMLAMQAIGDRTLRKEYLKQRDDRLAEAFNQLDAEDSDALR